jgi:CHAT domain-containing protein
MAIGARSILSYRWALLDALPTVECLINFYTSWIQGGNPKDRALQDAQKNLIEKGRKGEGLEQGWPTFDHPYYWAWTLIGDPL